MPLQNAPSPGSQVNKSKEILRQSIMSIGEWGLNCQLGAGKSAKLHWESQTIMTLAFDKYSSPALPINCIRPCPSPILHSRYSANVEDAFSSIHKWVEV